MFDIQENLKNLPNSPGVYIHKDQEGQVIYVGKAISLKNRVRQYFQSSKNMDKKVRAMVSHIAEFQWISCGSEMEAFILENNLIKEHKPKYNILLRDDKTYPYIKISTQEKWPRILKTRIISKDGSKYFGPYADAGAVNQIIDLLNNIYRLKKCSAKDFPRNFRPCLNFHMKQCDGICAGLGNQEEYIDRISMAIDYLNGNQKKMLGYLNDKMLNASENMDYEEAKKYRDYIAATKTLGEKQRVVLKTGTTIDVVIPIDKNRIAMFFVRGGKLIGREIFDLTAEASIEKGIFDDGEKATPKDIGEEDSGYVKKQEADLVSAFIRQHYGELSQGPAEILVNILPTEREILQEYLSQLWMKKVKILEPKKGEKKALVELALIDVSQMAQAARARVALAEDRRNQIGIEIHNFISLAGGGDRNYSGREHRIEAYDISNTNGVDTVGAMVVFHGMYKEKKEYRRFKVRTVEGIDDYGSMQEILYRRFQRLKKGDEKFSRIPDLILMDGGRGHVSAANKVLGAMDMSIPVMGMVKDKFHRTKALIYEEAGEFKEIPLKEKPLVFSFVGNIQEEVHRFAISYHRGIRDKKSLVSILDEIPGIGTVKRNALLGYFGSIDKIKEADMEELSKVPGITENLAKGIKDFLMAKTATRE